MDSPVILTNGGGHNWSYCWTTLIKDSFIVMKVCVGPATFFKEADRSDSMRMFATEILNNVLQACITDKRVRMKGWMHITPWANV